MRVVDDDGARCPGQPGEVVVRGYNVMRGYWHDDAATRAAIDADGWLRTGDVGVMDARGYLRITDRMKDMFIVGGFNVYPAEVEYVLLRHEAIAQAAVVGAPDERLGEVGCAFVVLRAEARRRPPRSWPAGRASRWRTTRCRAAWTSSTRCRSTPPARCSSISCAKLPVRLRSPRISALGELRLGGAASACGDG